VSLPTYPFERKRHWVEPHAAQSGEAKPFANARPGDDDGRPLPEQQPALTTGSAARPSAAPQTSAPAPVEKAGGNGNGRGRESARAEGAGSEPVLDEILAKQLRIMSEQLKLLRAD
jgi:acyl transferase domain-containing protein